MKDLGQKMNSRINKSPQLLTKIYDIKFTALEKKKKNKGLCTLYISGANDPKLPKPFSVFIFMNLKHNCRNCLLPKLFPMKDLLSDSTSWMSASYHTKAKPSKSSSK